MANWGDIFRKHVRAGEDHGAAAFAADEWEKRMQRKKKCNWTQDGYGEDAWDTGCGNRFMLEEGTPSDNHMEFCCFCGHPIDELPGEEMLG